MKHSQASLIAIISAFSLGLEGLVITCVSDVDDFAQQVYDYLYSLLERQREFDEGRALIINRELVSLSEDEILLDSKAMVPKAMVKWALESFLRENREKFSDYKVIELGDSFTVGKVMEPSKMELVSCEICGYFTPFPGELQTHRMTHFGI